MDTLTTNSTESTVGTVQKIVNVYLKLEERWKVFTAKAIRDYEYVIGNQISDEIKKQLDAAKRPALVFNLIQPLIIYIAGTLQSNKTAMRALPLREGDEVGAEMHTVLVSDWAMNECDGYDEIAKASLDAAICGVGWINNYWSTKLNPEGKWISEAFDPFRIKFDPDVRKQDQTDWRYYIVDGMYSCEEILAIYEQYLSPEMKQQIKDKAKEIEGTYQQIGQPVGWLNRVWNGVLDFFGNKQRRDDATGALIGTFVNAKNGLYRVIEFHDRRNVARKWIYNPITREKKPVEGAEKLDEAGLAMALQQNPGGSFIDINQDELWITVVVPALLPMEPIVERPYIVQGKGWQHKPIFGYDFHPDILKLQAPVDALIDPQTSFNQRRMSTLELIMDMLNPRWKVPKTSIEPDDKATWESGERGALMEYKAVGGAEPERIMPDPNAFAGLTRFAEEDRDLVQKISGVSPNLQGYKESANEPGVLYNARVQQGMTMLAYFFGHVQRAMRMTFDYCDANLQEFLTVPRSVRILAEPPDGMEGVVMSKEEMGMYWLRINWPTLDGVLNDVSQGEYDFRPDLTQLGQTARMMKFYEALEFVGKMPKELVLWPELFKLWDSPIAKKMAAFAEQVMGQLQLQKQQQAQLADAAAQAQIVGQVAKAKADAAGPASTIDVQRQAAERMGR